jgi:hypothetical protein
MEAGAMVEIDRWRSVGRRRSLAVDHWPSIIGRRSLAADR